MIQHVEQCIMPFSSQYTELSSEVPVREIIVAFIYYVRPRRIDKC